jgi:hypothetical protein
MKVMQNNDPNNWVYWLVTLGMAAFGSIAKISFDIINGKSIGLKLAFCQFIISMFAGALTILLSIALNFSPELTGCMSGSAGWLGAEMIKVIAERMKKNAGG